LGRCCEAWFSLDLFCSHTVSELVEGKCSLLDLISVSPVLSPCRFGGLMVCSVDADGLKCSAGLDGKRYMHRWTDRALAPV
jgi:hypothetical protein